VLTLSLALTLLLSGAPAGESRAAAPPVRGVLAPGDSLGGVRLGDTPATVRARWGRSYTRCAICPRLTWLFAVRRGSPAGAAVSFRDGRVAAVFTVGVPRGWRTTRGLALGDPADRVERVYGVLPWSRCLGYGALSMRSPRAVSSIYTFGESVYGFALTRPGEPVCQ
jgi:hypothetical protein